MKTKKLISISLLSMFAIIAGFAQNQEKTKNTIELYTPVTKLSAPPGESISYKIDVINNSNTIQTQNLSISGIPGTWNYDLKWNSYKVKQLSIKPNDKQTIDLIIDIPQKVNKGNYPITLIAGDNKLTVTINVSKQGTYQSEFSTEQPNLQGHSKSDFNFQAKLDNKTGEKQQYSLISNAPRGWSVIFKPNYKQATSVDIEPNSSKNVTIEVKAPQNIKEGTYKIPLEAVNNRTSAKLDLEVVITGSYELTLSTPTGLLSAEITAGDQTLQDLTLTNSGTAALKDIKLSASKPSGWDVTFEPKEIETIEPGQIIKAKAYIKADKKAIAGDYMATINAKSPEATSSITLRIAVKTPMIWGWIGVFIILIAIGAILFLFRKYGRR